MFVGAPYWNVESSYTSGRSIIKRSTWCYSSAPAPSFQEPLRANTPMVRAVSLITAESTGHTLGASVSVMLDLTYTPPGWACAPMFALYLLPPTLTSEDKASGATLARVGFRHRGLESLRSARVGVVTRSPEGAQERRRPSAVLAPVACPNDARDALVGPVARGAECTG